MIDERWLALAVIVGGLVALGSVVGVGAAGVLLARHAKRLVREGAKHERFTSLDGHLPLSGRWLRYAGVLLPQ